MASKAILAAVETELQHYPGVKMEVKNGGKHDRVVLSLDEKERFVTVPKSESDWRAGKNAVRDVRKTMSQLGARRSKVSAKRIAAVALNINTLNILIPPRSPLISRFMTKDKKAVSHWAIEIRSNPDLTAPPLLALKKATLPPGVERKPGLVSGHLHVSGGWMLMTSRAQVPALSSIVDKIRTVSVELYQDNGDELVFKLPRGSVPTSSTPPADEEALAPRHDPVPAPQVAEERRVADEPLAGFQDRPIFLQFPKQSVSVEAAVRILNKAKEKQGQNLRFTVTEGGFLSVVHKIN